MKTQTKYEEILLHEIRSMPTPLLPQTLKMLRSLKEGVLSVTRHQAVVGIASTGFCGAWQDDRSAEQIIADIEVHRSGLGKISLFPADLSADEITTATAEKL